MTSDFISCSCQYRKINKFTQAQMLMYIRRGYCGLNQSNILFISFFLCLTSFLFIVSYGGLYRAVFNHYYIIIIINLALCFFILCYFISFVRHFNFKLFISFCIVSVWTSTYFIVSQSAFYNTFEYIKLIRTDGHKYLLWKLLIKLHTKRCQRKFSSYK